MDERRPRGEPPPGSPRRRGVARLGDRRSIASLIGMAAILVLSSCDRVQRAAPAAPQAVVEPEVEVQTGHLRRGALSQQLWAPGSVVARRESHIGAEVSGRIVRVNVTQGDRVEAGDPLFEIDRAPYEMALRQAEAGVDVAEAESRQLEADLQRARTLRQQKVVAEQDIERLTTSLAVSRARVRQANEGVALARHHLERTLARAPYAGSVAARLADEGTTALVQPQTIVVVLQETAELEARASIAESQMGLVRVGDLAVVRIEGVPEPVHTHVSSVSDSIDPATRTYLVKMPVPNLDRVIKAGVFAHVEIAPKDRDEVLLAPREALRVEEGRTRLLVIRDGRVEALPIELGVFAENEAEVLSGADGGEVIVIGDAARTIAPGMRARPGTGTDGPP